MNCHDIARILDSGNLGALTASERRDAEVHAGSCIHCAPRWGVHSRLADLRIPAMPPEFAKQCLMLVAAHSRGNVLRLVPRRTLMAVSGFMVLAAAAAVVTVKYVIAPVQQADVSAPTREPAIAVQVVDNQIPKPENTVQIVEQGEHDMNKSGSIALAVAAMTVANVSPAQTATAQQDKAAMIMAKNDLDKDGIITRVEAKTANQPLQHMWDLYDADHNGSINLAEVTVFTDAVEMGTAVEKLGGSSAEQELPRKANPEQVIANNDQNGDGIVTRDEALTAKKALFGMWDQYDLNKDGKVDVAEVRKASNY